MTTKEIVIVMGYPAAGKTTITKEFTDQGYRRINRDTEGGSLDGLLALVKQAIHGGSVVLDNTYPTRESRQGIVKVAKEVGVDIRCVHLDTSFEDAQLNACYRMLDAQDKLLDEAGLAKLKNANLFPPVVQFTYKNKFEEPSTSEGFHQIEHRQFERKKPADWKNKAYIFDYDQTLRDVSNGLGYPTKPGEQFVLPGRAEKIQKVQKEGWLLLGASNQSGVAKGKLTYEDAVKCFEETNQKLGAKIDYQFCPHHIPPVKCFCRKPAPGMGALLIRKHKLNPAECIFVGDQTTDKTFAKRCGFKFYHADEFFRIR